MAKKKIIIDAEFASLCGPLSVSERAQLEANIEAEGCREPLILWDGKDILIDGHNRHEICESLGEDFKTVTLPFKDRDDARNWIINNQLGRRNITPEQASFLRGKRYLAEKSSHGGDRKSDQTKESSSQNGHLKTHEDLAAELGVSPKTIQRDAEFAQAIDTLEKNVGHDFKASVLSGDVKIPKQDLVALSELPKAEQKKAVAGGKESIKEAVKSAHKSESKPKPFDSDARGDFVMDWGRREISRWPMSARKELEHWFKQLAREALTLPEGEHQ